MAGTGSQPVKAACMHNLALRKQPTPDIERLSITGAGDQPMKVACTLSLAVRKQRQFHI